MTFIGPEFPATFAGHQLYDRTAASAEIDLYPKSDTTTFHYPTGMKELTQHWYVVRRYLNGRLHSIINATGYKLTYIRADVAVVAIPVGDGPGRRYKAVGFMSIPTRKGNTNGT